MTKYKHSYWRCALLGCSKMGRYKVITSKTSFLTICDFHIDAIETMGVYPIEPLQSTQGFDPGWEAIRRENLTVGAKCKPQYRKVKYEKTR